MDLKGVTVVLNLLFKEENNSFPRWNAMRAVLMALWCGRRCLKPDLTIDLGLWPLLYTNNDWTCSRIVTPTKSYQIVFYCRTPLKITTLLIILVWEQTKSWLLQSNIYPSKLKSYTKKHEQSYAAIAWGIYSYSYLKCWAYLNQQGKGVSILLFSASENCSKKTSSCNSCMNQHTKNVSLLTHSPQQSLLMRSKWASWWVKYTQCRHLKVSVITNFHQLQILPNASQNIRYARQHTHPPSGYKHCIHMST